MHLIRRRRLFVFAKNAVANVARGGAASIVALLLPPFLTHAMPQEAFAAWSLVLQLGAYVSYFDFGIQTALARFVAHSTERQDFAYRDKVVSTAFAMLTAAGVLALLAILLLTLFLPRIFHQLHGPLLVQVRIALLLVGGALAVCLPSSTFAALFVGLQRNEVPALIIGVPRLVGGALVVLVVYLGGGLPSMAAVTAAMNLLSFLFQFMAYRKWVPELEVSFSGLSWKVMRELIDYCFSLTVWSLGLLLVTGLDLTIVGAYRFQEVGYYAIAATLVAFMNGLFGAIFGAMSSPAAVLHAREDKAGLGELVSTATRFGMLLLLITGLPMIFCTHWILRLWLGAAYAAHAAPILQLLTIANMIRVCISPYIIAMISTGEQRRIILVPILEGVVNLTSSVIMGYYLGAIGVAIGTLIGSFVSTGGNIFYTMRNNRGIKLKADDYLRDALLRPLLCALPAVLLGFIWPHLTRLFPLWLSWLIAGLATGTSAWFFWSFTLTSKEQESLLVRLRGGMGNRVAIRR